LEDLEDAVFDIEEEVVDKPLDVRMSMRRRRFITMNHDWNVGG